METNRIKEVAKKRGLSIQELSDRLGFRQYQSLTTKMKNPTLKSLNEIADAISCEVAELLPVGSEYAHFYDEKGIWQGIRKK